VNQQFSEPKGITSWAVVDYSPNPSRDRQANERFVKMIADNCQRLGMRNSVFTVLRVISYSVPIGMCMSFFLFACKHIFELSKQWLLSSPGPTSKEMEAM